MGAQHTAQEINAAIARLMREVDLYPAPDYINDEIDRERFMGVAEMAVKQTGTDAWDRYVMLRQLCASSAIAMVAALRLMDIDLQDKGKTESPRRPVIPNTKNIAARLEAQMSTVHSGAYEAMKAGARELIRMGDAATVEREACAKLLESSTADLLLLAGEMTSGEIRTVKAVLAAKARQIRARCEQTEH